MADKKIILNVNGVQTAVLQILISRDTYELSAVKRRKGTNAHVHQETVPANRKFPNCVSTQEPTLTKESTREQILYTPADSLGLFISNEPGKNICSMQDPTNHTNTPISAGTESSDKNNETTKALFKLALDVTMEVD